MKKVLFVVVCFLLTAMESVNVVCAADLVLRDTPCRLYDSRNIGGTGLGSKVDSATIETWGDVGVAQGGESGCGVKYGTAGIVVNLTVYQPNSAGYARIWRFGSTEPLPASISFASGQTDESTGILVGVGIQDGKLSLNSPFSAAHFIIDLAGSIDGGGGGSEGFPDPEQVRVLSFINAPIAGAQPGDRLVVSSPTANPFIGHSNEYAVWKGIPSCSPSSATCWDFYVPGDGDIAYEASTRKYWKYSAFVPGWTEIEN